MRYLTLGCVLLLAGCVGPSGPVIGDWRGYEQSIGGYRDRMTEIILDGTAEDTTGTYHLVGLTPASGFAVNTHNLNWSGRWTKTVLLDPSGAPYTVYHLDQPPPAHLPDYALLSTGGLLPVIDPQHPDLGPDAMLIVLRPLPRTAYGYGRP